jgi:hypothetical protein
METKLLTKEDLDRIRKEFEDMHPKAASSWLDMPGLPEPREIMRRILERDGILWPRPIPVSERLPKEADISIDSDEQTVLCFDGEEDCEWACSVYCDGSFWARYPVPRTQRLAGVTHWLPLPPKPE